MVFTANCWPNEQFPFCWSDDTLSFFQLFTEVSVNGFFLVMTTMFAVASLFSVPDAYYHYNFPMLVCCGLIPEKKLILISRKQTQKISRKNST
jgi:hypothetical protein